MLEKRWKSRSLEPLQNHWKATEKPLKSHWKENWKTANRWKSSTSWNSFQFFSFLQKVSCQARPTPPVGTIFAVKTLVFSIHFCFTEKLKNKKQKTKQTIGRVALACFSVVFSVAFQCLFGFLHFCKKSTIIKHHPSPPLALDLSVS